MIVYSVHLEIIFACYFVEVNYCSSLSQQIVEGRCLALK